MAKEKPAAAPEGQAPAGEQPQQPVFVIEKIYVKDLSLEIPGAPQVFLQREAPQISVEVHNAGSVLGEGVYETVITVTVTAKHEDKTVFLVEVAQAGIFRIGNIPSENLDGLLAVACPNILFPYAREAVSDLVTRAGFPPVLLSPVNFEALYMQQLQQRREAQQAAEGATTH